jgi:hypothetical protein
MIEPVEAELARPPIFNERQEAVLRDEDVELDRAISRLNANSHTNANGSAASPSASETPSQTATLTEGALTPAQLENGEKRTIVTFEPGTRENPREWTKGRKW